MGEGNRYICATASLIRKCPFCRWGAGLYTRVLKHDSKCTQQGLSQPILPTAMSVNFRGQDIFAVLSSLEDMHILSIFNIKRYW